MTIAGTFAQLLPMCGTPERSEGAAAEACAAECRRPLRLGVVLAAVLLGVLIAAVLVEVQAYMVEVPCERQVTVERQQ